MKLEDTYHPSTSVLIEGLKKMKSEGNNEAATILCKWDQSRQIVDRKFIEKEFNHVS